MLNKRIDAIYINLDSALARRQRIEIEFKKHNINVQRIEAVRWTQLTTSDQSRYYSENLNKIQYHSPLVNGEKGCYVSHIEAWRRLLVSNAQCMVVLEDDVQLTPDFLRVVNALSELDQPWDMVKLIGRKNEKVRSQRPLCDGFELIDYSRVPSYTAGYLVSRRGAQKMLESRQPFGRPIDIDLRFWWENNLIIYGVRPAVLVLDETSDVSTISGRKSNLSLIVKWRKFKVKMRLTFLNYFNKKIQKKL